MVNQESMRVGRVTDTQLEQWIDEMISRGFEIIQIIRTSEFTHSLDKIYQTLTEEANYLAIVKKIDGE